MRFQYRYYGASQVANTASSTSMSFVPDTLRAPTHFVADLHRKLPFREAISALHDVVVADLRTLPKDRTDYFAWLQTHESQMLTEFMARARTAQAKVAPLQAELAEVRKAKAGQLGPYEQAKRRYFNYLWETNRDAWIVLDPVITVHPDKVFFECFSRDESSYASLSCSHNVFERLGDFACGTTNIDYSSALYEEFQKIRDYKTTRLAIEPAGFQVQTADDPAFVEEKIDLPDSWVRGFLQVSAAMTLPAHVLELHPMDVHNLCFVLRRQRERVGPRSLRFVLTPGEPIRVLCEPWGHELVFARSIYTGPHAGEVRLWGRRRLLTLERLIPVAQRFTVHLLGTGLPSFWIAEMPEMQYTLGLSGWTANDWSRAGQFDLLGPRHTVGDAVKTQVFEALASRWFASTRDVSIATGLAAADVEAALGVYTQAGRVVYDLTQRVWRLRELTRDPLPFDQLRYASEQEEAAAKLVALGAVSRIERHTSATPGGQRITGIVRQGKKPLDVELSLDADERLVGARCACDFYVHNKLHRGPCEHMLALRMLSRQLADAPAAAIAEA